MKFFGDHPESTNFLIRVFSDEGTPANYRSIKGYTVNTFVWTNERG